MGRIIVCGYMIRHPVAGNLLAYFHYVLGLHRLGHEVVYLEENQGIAGASNAALELASGESTTYRIELVGDVDDLGLVVESVVFDTAVDFGVGHSSRVRSRDLSSSMNWLTSSNLL